MRNNTTTQKTRKRQSSSTRRKPRTATTPSPAAAMHAQLVQIAAGIAQLRNRMDFIEHKVNNTATPESSNYASDAGPYAPATYSNAVTDSELAENAELERHNKQFAAERAEINQRHDLIQANAENAGLTPYYAVPAATPGIETTDSEIDRQYDAKNAELDRQVAAERAETEERHAVLQKKIDAERDYYTRALAEVDEDIERDRAYY